MHCKTHRWRSDERQGSTFPMHVRIRFQVAFLLVHSALLVLLLKILQQRRLCIHGINEMHAPGWTLWWVRPWTCECTHPTCVFVHMLMPSHAFTNSLRGCVHLALKMQCKQIHDAIDFDSTCFATRSRSLSPAPFIVLDMNEIWLKLEKLVGNVFRLPTDYNGLLCEQN